MQKNFSLPSRLMVLLTEKYRIHIASNPFCFLNYIKGG